MKSRALFAMIILIFVSLSGAGYTYAADEAVDDDLFADYEVSDEQEPVPDPLFWFNYSMYHVNDRIYYWAVKPFATGYKKVTPTPVRTGIKNFFHNLMFPIRFVNTFFQGKFSAAATELDCFIINTTVGILGVMQPAQNTYGLVNSNEDLGQTLGSYQIGEGFYLVLPIIGPLTFRDTLGRVGDYFLSPLSYLEPIEVSIGTSILKNTNATSFRLGDYEALKASAVDHYIAMKDAYVQYRRLKVNE